MENTSEVQSSNIILNTWNLEAIEVPYNEKLGNSTTTDYPSEIEKLKKRISNLEDELQREKAKNSSPFTPSPTDYEYEVKDPTYDGIININSIKGLAQGWKLAFKNYPEFSQRISTPSIILSVVGNYNKGKTWLLSQLCKIDGLPQGFSYSTEGISFKYTTDKKLDGIKTPMLAIDTKGSSTAIEIEGIKPKKEITDEKDEEKFGQDFKERLTDHLATEDIVQNFITTIATVNIIVVSSITFEDQRLINKIKRRYYETNTGLFVVHNLYNCTLIKEVEEVHIKKRILPCFNIEKKVYAYDVDNMNNAYYEESLPNSKRIVHIILAREGTEAGNYYNQSSFHFLVSLLHTQGTKKINIVEKFVDFIKNSLSNYIQETSEVIKKSVKIENKTTTSDTKTIEIPDMIIYPEIKDIKLKTVSSDESGMLHTNFITYSIYYEKDKSDENSGKLIIKLECPDFENEQEMNIKSRIETISDDFRIHVKGKKQKKHLESGEKLLHDIRKEGEFEFATIFLSHKDYGVPETKNDKEYKNGCILIIYTLKKKDEWDE